MASEGKGACVRWSDSPRAQSSLVEPTAARLFYFFKLDRALTALQATPQGRPGKTASHTVRPSHETFAPGPSR